ncbi:MAG: DUF1631 family protein, partial [Rhizobacter sp.]|nr:DUF1631 family protein [Rhizobacter sp.]
VQAVEQGAKLLAASVAEPAVALKRRELLPTLQAALPHWQQGMMTLLKTALASGAVTQTRLGELPVAAAAAGRAGGKLSLVDDDTIEHEILSSRLALAMMDRASWEFTDLRSRMNMLEKREELDTNDILRPHVFARIVTSSWLAAPLGFEAWRMLQSVLHEELSLFAEEAYHEINRFLLQRHVLPEVDLRPFIRRSNTGGSRPVVAASGGFGVATGLKGATDFQPSARSQHTPSEVHEETRLMTRAGSLARGGEPADQVLNRLNRLVGRQLPDFAPTSHAPAPPSPRLSAAIAEAQETVARRLAAAPPAADGTPRAPVGTPALLEELQQRKLALKQAATSPVERATIEIVALLFQSILMEDAIPATVRVWFARLQMPVLRVAVSEPDFFATVEHPARRLIDRMGACVMGFDSSSRVVGDLLEKEIKRVVQVVEAYPDTGRRVFQTVLTEFEKFLEHYFKNENEASKKGVSLAAQVEQRETLAIQYTIELRKMLNDVPVQEGVREFLFQVWADVLATTAVKSGTGDATKEMKRAAADLIWSASAKVSRAERAEVIRKLPPLLKTLRDGMEEAGIPLPKQDEHIQRLNNALAAAFTAKAAAISHERLEELMGRLETLEELLPEAEDVDIDESLVMDLSGHESSELEVVGEGGSMPTPAMLAWARELQVGSWYMLDYRNRNEQVQLAWQGMRRQLTLFVSPQGRGVLFQQHRLAAFLQAGLLVPAQEEALTVKATRSAMAKLDGDPSRLLN